MTDIKDPQIDEKPPPYECSACGYSTWSWNDAKKHACATMKKELRNMVEAGRTASINLSALINSPVFNPLIQTLEKARDGSTGEFKESKITLPSKSGKLIFLRVKRGSPDSQASAEQHVFSVELEISQQDSPLAT